MNWNKLYLLCLLVCSIVTLVFSIVTYSAFVNLNVSYNLLISTWQENPIIGIRAIPSTQRCSALTDLKDTLTLNTTKDLVLNQDVYWTEFPKYEFGGFYDGCDCRDVSYIVSSRYPDVSRTLTTGSCSYNETRAGCIYIDTYTKAQSMSILNNNHRQDARLLSQQLCLLKTKDNSFMDQINRHIANGYQPCNQYGYKVCGKGMNRFCIDKRSSCPITYISIGTNQSSSNNSIKAQAIVGGNDAVYVNIGGYEYNQQLPISVFSVGMGQYVCLDDYRKQTTTKSSQYILQKGSQYNCAANSDPRFTMVYQTDEFNLFESNLHNDLVLRFPRKDRYREVYSKEPYYVKSRNYLQWDTTNQYCIRLGSRIQEKKVKFDSVHNYWLVAMIINIVGLVVCCFFICRHIDHEGFNTDNGFTSKMDLLNYGSKILQLPFIILALSKSNSVIGYFEDLSYEQCSDHLVNQDIKNIYDTLESQSVKGWMAIVWLIVSLLVDIMVTLYKYNKVRQDSKYQQHRLMDKLSMQEQ